MGVIAKNSKACPSLCWNCGDKLFFGSLHIVIEKRRQAGNRYGECLPTVNNWEEGSGSVILK